MDSISEWLQGMGSGIHAKQRMCQVCLAFKVWRNPLCFQNYSSKSSTAESVYQVQDWTNNLTFIVSVTPWVRKHKVHQWSSIWLPHFTSSEVHHWDSQRTKSWTSSAVTPKKYGLKSNTAWKETPETWGWQHHPFSDISSQSPPTTCWVTRDFWLSLLRA